MTDPLAAIATPGPIAPEADTSTAKAIEELEAARFETETESLKTDIDARKTYASKIYRLVVWWLIGVAVILLLHMYRFTISIPIPMLVPPNAFEWVRVTAPELRALPDSVLIALVAGSTTSILGILASVIAYIFRVPGPPSPSRTKGKGKTAIK